MKDLKHSVKGITIAVVLAGASALLAEEDRDCDGEIVCESERGRLSVRCDGATLTSWKSASPGFDGDVFFMPAKTPWVGTRKSPAGESGGPCKGADGGLACRAGT